MDIGKLVCLILFGYKDTNNFQIITIFAAKINQKLIFVYGTGTNILQEQPSDAKRSDGCATRRNLSADGNTNGQATRAGACK
jgi:hypothetical protein